MKTLIAIVAVWLLWVESASLAGTNPADLAAPNVDFNPASLRDPADAWQFGYGQYDQELGRIESFTPLPHWTGSAWQGGSELPDANLGWVTLSADGGHPDSGSCWASIQSLLHTKRFFPQR